VRRAWLSAETQLYKALAGESNAASGSAEQEASSKQEPLDETTSHSTRPSKVDSQVDGYVRAPE